MSDPNLTRLRQLHRVAALPHYLKRPTKLYGEDLRKAKNYVSTAQPGDHDFPGQGTDLAEKEAGRGKPGVQGALRKLQAREKNILNTAVTSYVHYLKLLDLSVSGFLYGMTREDGLQEGKVLKDARERAEKDRGRYKVLAAAVRVLERTLQDWEARAPVAAELGVSEVSPLVDLMMV